MLPFWAAYKIADCLYFFIGKVFKYRNHVVFENLKNSFPEKNETEINIIAEGYYKYMSDLLIESFKSLSMSKKTYLNRVRYVNKDVIEKYANKRRNILLVTSHFGNWEWVAVSMPLVMDFLPVIVYKPMSNSYFNRLFCDIRTKYGSKVVPMKNSFRAMMEYKDTLSTMVLNADQSPGMDNSFWVNFLGRETAFFNGTEKLAIRFGYPVIYMNIAKIERGQYEVSFELLCENPKETKETEITQLYASRLEKEIRRKPETWLWSHRRWKLVKPIS